VKDLTVAVSGKDKTEKKLLDGVSFCVQPGDVVALMGPSGAGKTTLLNRIVGRGINGQVHGVIKYGGQAIEDARSSIGYVTQDDIMYETLTPRQNLMFAAEFLQASNSAAERRTAVEDVMQKLRLVKCADTVVGIPGLVKGISGGERKRTNVAMSLLGRPALLLLDEPTSGLDSKMAEELMADVSSVAAQGCTAIATIHQPSEAVFERFNKVLLLEGGRVAYYGPVEGLRAKIGNLGFAVPDRKPLPELLLDALEIPDADGPDKGGHAERLAQLRGISESPAANEGDPLPPALAKSSRLGFCGQVLVLLRRGALALKRNKVLTVVRAGQTILSTILVGWIFAQLDANLDGVRLRMFSAFLLVFAQFLFALLGVVNTFPSERAVFLREAQDRWYHPAAFYLAKVVLDTFMQCLFPMLATVIGYLLIGLNTDKAERIFIFYGIMVLTTNIGASMGFIVSAAVSNVSTALAIAPGMIMPQMLLCGIFIQAESMPQPFRALSFAVAAKYGLQAIITNEFTCEAKEACTAAWRTSPGQACESSPCDYCCTDDELAISGGICPVLTCNDALRFLGIDGDNIWPSGDTNEDTIKYNVLMLLLLLVVFRIQGMNVLFLSYRKAARSG